MKIFSKGRLCAAAAAAVLLGACATVPITGRKQLSIIPQSQLITMSFDSYKQLISESKLSSDPQKVAQVREVGTRVAQAAEAFMKERGLESELKNYKWEFNLIQDDKTVNAFCMPGGKVAVYTGILPLTKDANGLAIVVGHEVAHAIANHGGERMSQMLVTQLGGVALATALKKEPEKTQELWLAAYGIGSQVGVLLPYSRSHELEADRIGLILAARAGYDPNAAVPFWERMEKTGGSAPPEFLSTHPASAHRIDEIKKYIPDAMQYYKKK